MEHRIRTKIPHAIPTRPDPTPTQNPQNSNDQVSNHETPAKELHANLLGRQVQLPRNLARNSIGQSFNRVRKRCNPNDLNSMFERVAGELRAKLLGGGGAWPGFETTRQWLGLVLWAGCFEGCWLLLVVLCPLARVLVG